MDEMTLTSPDIIIQSSTVPWAMRQVIRALQSLESGSLDITLPDGRHVRFSGPSAGPHARFTIRSYAFIRRLSHGIVGFADGYIADEWDADDLASLLTLFAANQSVIKRFSANVLVRLVQMARHALNRNSRAGSRRNIHAHYDLGNAFYASWLDRSMTYSSGLKVGEDLEASQTRKYAAIAALAGIGAGDHVLELGCGWGGFAEYAAREIGCQVTALTISEAQYEYAKKRMADAGIAGKVTVKLCDYRDESGQYDRIVSIEMFEAVGEAYWRTFFDTLRLRLKPGGQAALQIITIREDLFARYRREMDFIRHYIFPGGMLPTLPHLDDMGIQAGLEKIGTELFGKDYAATCRHWRLRFEDAWPFISTLGFDARFQRLWRFYLAYCEAGFEAGSTNVCQIAFRKPALSEAV
ncbi:Cfa Cyclopropane fatty acid synthase and related methyltransferases [Rhabdaerophilaceae bacterium]